MKNLLLFLAVIPFFLTAQEKYTINGYVKDASNGEALIGATVLIEELGTGNITNVYGFYSITLPPGEYSVVYRYIGFVSQKNQISLEENSRIDVELVEEQTQLEEVVVTAKPEDENVTSTEMSVAELDIKTISKIPAFLGEVDVIKSVQLLPGVSTVGEGSSGFNVRGGSVGQNLVLLDEAPIYNSSHMLGFFSVFNPDAVKDVKLYKGGIPARFGGRLSSVLDIRMKEGNIKEYEVNGGIGTIFSRLAVEGPIKKEKASFIVAGRRSYIDILAKPFTDVFDNGAGLYFYDLTAKANWNISDKDRVYVSGYWGRDVFNFDERQGINWGSKTGTFRWNHLYNERLFSNLTFYVSDYDYELKFGEDELDKFEWMSNITTYDLKPEFTYFLNTNNELTFGAEAIFYRFSPAEANFSSNGVNREFSLPKKRAFEYGLYVGNKQTVNEKIDVEYGLRFSGFNYIGPGEYYTFNDTIPGERRSPTAVFEADDWESIKGYNNLEPRVSVKYQLNRTSSIKASYNRMAQYIHLISNTTASNPLDIWTPSTNNIQPQTGQQWAAGYFRNFKNNMYEFSFEAYYRKTENQIDYIDGAELFINDLLEGDVISGQGRAYGAEFYLKKNEGRLTGWLSYTLGRTELKIDGINYLDDLENRTGKWYPARYDQTHNLKIAGFYELNKRWSVSANFTYLSGTPTTFPTHRYQIEYLTIPENANNSRNNLRIPDYHRLDVSFTLLGREVRKNGKPRKNRDSLVITFYNIYNRKNPFSIYFWQGEDRVEMGEPAPTRATQVSILGSIVPSVTYNFKF
ncbi:TonB-dependent receptor [Ekhidna sp.]|uniref:TonB-dependent receptor n=1 Tax=Ekhidna sp. TaxID=2608089 RepID=UPI003C7C6D04